jgi:hypothetical protein
VEPSGGDPGAYLRGQFAGAVPTWYVPVGASSPFLGSYQSEHVTALSLDLNIMQGFQAPDRFLTLDLRSSFGTGDFSKGLEAFYIGADISNFQPGWSHYDFSLPASSAAIPSGWTLLRGDGSAASASDWGRLMSDVETLGFELGAPGYALPESRSVGPRVRQSIHLYQHGAGTCSDRHRRGRTASAGLSTAAGTEINPLSSIREKLQNTCLRALHPLSSSTRHLDGTGFTATNWRSNSGCSVISQLHRNTEL